MEAQEIQAKIEKVCETISKKQDLIGKRTSQAEKIIDKMMKTDFVKSRGIVLADNSVEGLEAFYKQVDQAIRDDRKEGECIADNADRSDVYYMNCDLWYPCIDSIKSAYQAINEKKNTLARYQELLEKAEQKEKALANLPQCMKDWMKDMVEIWDAWDAKKKESVKEAHETVREIEKREYAREAELGYNYAVMKNDETLKAIRSEIADIRKRYTEFEWRELPYLSEEQIHELNVKSAKDLVQNLYERVCHIVGFFEDASGLEVSRNNEGFAVINGIVKGNGKIAKVQSVGAGGWNIQRFHIRVLVHEIKPKSKGAN